MAVDDRTGGLTMHLPQENNTLQKIHYKTQENLNKNLAAAEN